MHHCGAIHWKSIRKLFSAFADAGLKILAWNMLVIVPVRLTNARL